MNTLQLGQHHTRSAVNKLHLHSPATRQNTRFWQNGNVFVPNVCFIFDNLLCWQAYSFSKTDIYQQKLKGKSLQNAQEDNNRQMMEKEKGSYITR